MDRDERLMAYVDGELPVHDRAAFELEMARDPQLAAEVAQHQRLAGRIGAAFAPVAEEPVPPHLLALASAANDPGVRRNWGLPQWGAMAACLALGVLVGRAVLPQQGPLAAEGGRLVVRGDLDRALTAQLASQPGEVRVGLTFRDSRGRMCRTFASGEDRLAGLACREDDRWIAEAASAWSPAASEYRTASVETPPAVLAAVDGLIAGEPLDAAAERAARDRGWRP
jgi:hypothetical protein